MKTHTSLLTLLLSLSSIGCGGYVLLTPDTTVIHDYKEHNLTLLVGRRPPPEDTLWIRSWCHYLLSQPVLYLTVGDSVSKIPAELVGGIEQLQESIEDTSFTVFRLNFHDPDHWKAQQASQQGNYDCTYRSRLMQESDGEIWYWWDQVVYLDLYTLNGIIRHIKYKFLGS